MLLTGKCLFHHLLPDLKSVYKCKIYNFAKAEAITTHTVEKKTLKQTYTNVGPHCLISCNNVQSKIGGKTPDQAEITSDGI